VTLDGERCALARTAPDFPLVCERVPMRRTAIRVTYVVFDLLSLDGRDLTSAPYSERRAQPPGRASRTKPERLRRPRVTLDETGLEPLKLAPGHVTQGFDRFPKRLLRLWG
jgi:ATP-dependent DNA ligase